jgi:hypothetical protein
VREESVGGRNKDFSRDSSMSVQRLTILIQYRTCAACSFKRFAYSIGFAAILFFPSIIPLIKIDVLWPWVFPPSPAFSGLSGGPSLGLTVDALGV